MIVDANVHTQCGGPGQFLSGTGGAEHERPGLVCQLDGGCTNPASRGMDQDTLAHLQVAPVEQSIVGGEKHLRGRSGLYKIPPFWNTHCHAVVGYGAAGVPSATEKAEYTVSLGQPDNPVTRLCHHA